MNEDKDRLKSHWIGSRVISISNAYQSDSEDLSMHIGEVVDIVSIGNTLMPLVLLDDEAEAQISFSTIVEYTDSLWGSLSKLDAKDRWIILTSFVRRFGG